MQMYKDLLPQKLETTPYKPSIVQQHNSHSPTAAGAHEFSFSQQDERDLPPKYKFKPSSIIERKESGAVKLKKRLKPEMIDKNSDRAATAQAPQM